MGVSRAGAHCSFNRVFRIGIIYKMTLEQIFEGNEEMNHVAIREKKSPGDKSASAKALRSMPGVASE